MSNNKENVQLRISIINVPDELSPLKLRTFLRSEAADVQKKADVNGFAIIRLFLPVRILSAFGQRKLDALLESIVNTHPNIYRVELRTVHRSLALEQMKLAAQEAQNDLTVLGEGAKQFSEAETGDQNSTIH